MSTTNDQLVMACYGGGTNSTAMILRMVERGERIDIVAFADTGGELPATYAYVELFSAWLVEHGYPAITVVKKGGKVESLEEACLRLKQLPSVAYHRKTCSQRFKLEPQDKLMNNWPPAKAAWARGEQIIKCIGFDADESYRAKDYSDHKYQMRFPLIEDDLGREECIAIIRQAGLPLPGKSSCFFCPNRKQHEILDLPLEYQERAIAMERNAELTVIAGLGRTWRWEDLIRSDREQLKLFDITDFRDSSVDMPCGCID